MTHTGFGQNFFHTMYEEMFDKNEKKWRRLESGKPQKSAVARWGTDLVYDVFSLPLLKFRSIPAGMCDLRLFINVKDRADYSFDSDYKDPVVFNISRRHFFAHFTRYLESEPFNSTIKFDLNTSFLKNIYGDILKRMESYFIRDFFMRYFDIPSTDEYINEEKQNGNFDHLKRFLAFDAMDCIKPEGTKAPSPLFRYPKYAENLKNVMIQMQKEKDQITKLFLA